MVLDMSFYYIGLHIPLNSNIWMWP